MPEALPTARRMGQLCDRRYNAAMDPLMLQEYRREHAIPTTILIFGTLAPDGSLGTVRLAGRPETDYVHRNRQLGRKYNWGYFPACPSS